MTIITVNNLGEHSLGITGPTPSPDQSSLASPNPESTPLPAHPICF